MSHEGSTAVSDRILDFADGAAYLRVRKDQLIVERKDQPEVSTPLCEVAALLLTHPQATCSQPVLARLMSLGGVVIVCDDKHLPVGMMLPLTGHSIQTERFAAQAAAPPPAARPPPPRRPRPPPLSAPPPPGGGGGGGGFSFPPSL